MVGGDTRNHWNHWNRINTDGPHVHIPLQFKPWHETLITRLYVSNLIKQILTFYDNSNFFFFKSQLKKRIGLYKLLLCFFYFDLFPAFPPWFPASPSFPPWFPAFLPLFPVFLPWISAFPSFRSLFPISAFRDSCSVLAIYKFM